MAISSAGIAATRGLPSTASSAAIKTGYSHFVTPSSCKPTTGRVGMNCLCMLTTNRLASAAAQKKASTPSTLATICGVGLATRQKHSIINYFRKTPISSALSWRYGQLGIEMARARHRFNSLRVLDLYKGQFYIEFRFFYQNIS